MPFPNEYGFELYECIISHPSSWQEGRDSRLYPLTKVRSKPAVPIAGRFRLIDFPISNCIHSGLKKIFVLTQFASESLHRHIFLTYRFDNFTRDFVTILSAQQTLENRDWYQGTADAVRKNLGFIRPNVDLVLILSGDHLLPHGLPPLHRLSS